MEKKGSNKMKINITQSKVNVIHNYVILLTKSFRSVSNNNKKCTLYNVQSSHKTEEKKNREQKIHFM